MADVSVQNERINGWIPSSAANVIMNWTERIKTQPHDDRDNCFQHFESKGPCGMTVNNDIDDDSATKHSDSQMRRRQRETKPADTGNPMRSDTDASEHRAASARTSRTKVPYLESDCLFNGQMAREEMVTQYVPGSRI